MRAALGEGVRDRPAHPARGSGDDDDLARARDARRSSHRVAPTAACSASSSAQRSASAMITSAGLAAPCVGSTLPSTTNRLGTPHTRWSESTTLSCGGEAHPRAADQVGVAVDLQRVLGAGVLPDLLHRLAWRTRCCAVVVAQRVREVGDRHPELVDLVGQRDAVVGLRQQLAQHAEHDPVVVVAHVLAQRLRPSGLRPGRARPSRSAAARRVWIENPRAKPRRSSVS